MTEPSTFFQPNPEDLRTAGFAEIDQNNKVIRVICVNRKDLLDEDGVESDSVGEEFCKKLTNSQYRWIRTYKNGAKRNVQAGIDFLYDEEKDVFIRNQPYPSWIYNEDMLDWDPPIPYPDDYHLHCEHAYIWDEINLRWIFNDD
jgi:hypothetical protein